jgi:hypothetical protein
MSLLFDVARVHFRFAATDAGPRAAHVRLCGLCNPEEQVLGNGSASFAGLVRFGQKGRVIAHCSTE